MVVIVDYGAGNLHSVAKAIARLGYEPVVTADPAPLARAQALILPGVGAARDIMRGLQERELIEPLLTYLQSGRPFLGVCMGLQVLMEGSEEGGWQPCLGVFAGVVRRLPPGQKVPHMGWNRVWQRRPHPVFADIPDGAFFYFVHSYYADPTDPAIVAAEADYGRRFPAVLAWQNIVATQFHPEKSADLGLRFYANFLRWAGLSPGRLAPSERSA